MTDHDIKEVQSQLKSVGLYDGIIDGIWGNRSKAGLEALINLARQRKDVVAHAGGNVKMAWGRKVSAEFRMKVAGIASALNMTHKTACDDLMCAMAFESGETFSPSVKNGAGSGATGLIQFMPSTAIALGTTTAALAKMTNVEQLDYVLRYLLPYKGRLKNLGDIYMAILWPAGVGKGDEYVLWDKTTKPETYRQNAGLDVNRDNKILRGEAVKKVYEKMAPGMSKENYG